MKGILGQKAGMTQVFTKDGQLIPVTVIDVSNNVVTQIKNTNSNGYDSVQLSTGEQKAHRVPKAKRGHFEKAKTTPKRFTKEIRNMSGFELGVTVKAGDLFSPGELVDVTGTSKGKGFAGVIKRHNQSIGPKSHGSQFHRQMGSMGDIEGNKISKGKNMAGQMGNVQRTTQNLVIIDINDKEGYILVKGSIPGPNKSYVVVKSAVKGLEPKEVVVLVNYETKSTVETTAEIKTKAEVDVKVETDKVKPVETTKALKEEATPEAPATEDVKEG